MDEKRILKMVVAGLLLIGLLSIGGSAIHQSGWSQGYMMGLLASNSDSAAQMLPYALQGYGFSPFGYGLGLFFKFAMFLFFFAVIGKFFRFWSWRMAGPGGEGWHRHWHHGPSGRGEAPTAGSHQQPTTKATESETAVESPPSPEDGTAKV